MEYKLCNDNMICCGTDCMRCANLVHEALTNENKNLKVQLDKLNKERDRFFNEIKRITEERNKIHDELKAIKEDNSKLQLDLDIANARIHTERVSYDYLSSLYKELEEKCAKLEKENDYLDQECESLLAKFSERIAELEKENNDLRVASSELLYRNRLLTKTTAPNIVQKVYIYDELNNKIESLKEDIIRLDKCLSNRQCVQLERIKEEDHA